MADQQLSGDRADLTNGLAALDKLSWFWKRFLSRGVDEKGWRLFSGLTSGSEPLRLAREIEG
jgi:hypothetical protein